MDVCRSCGDTTGLPLADHVGHLFGGEEAVGRRVDRGAEVLVYDVVRSGLDGVSCESLPLLSCPGAQALRHDVS